MIFKIRNRGFTLIEMTITITGALIMLLLVITAYMKFIHTRDNVDAKQNLIQESYYAMEKFNILLKDFTIDYEEYFNRAMVGCDSGGVDFNRNVGNNGYCNLFTNYGNGNNLSGYNNTQFALYYCSSVKSEETPFVVLNGSNPNSRTGCYSTGYQSFGQYNKQFRDMKDNVDTVHGVVNDDDDTDVGKGPDAILNATGVKELYLISQNGDQRILLRRTLINSGDWNGTGGIGDIGSELQYNIQILKLKGFDAGSNHDFNSTGSIGMYDGVIDTRACDTELGFVCNGSGLGNGIYSGYHLALDSNDGWANLFPDNITISDRNLIIYPTKNPDYARKEKMINPYFTISITSKLYGKIRYKKLGSAIDNFNLTLQTTLNTKNNYTK